MSKNHKTAEATKNTITLTADDPTCQKQQREAMAQAAVAPEIQAALTVQAYSPMPRDTVAVDALIAELVKRSADGRAGDLSRGEAMLVAQAHALDAIFGECARRARGNMGEYPQAVEIYLRMALRAQSNCRATWETLAAIKNPPKATFVQQANIANGPQQVNNGASPARAGKIEKVPIKLMEGDNGQRMVPGAPGTAGAANLELEAVGAIDRTKDLSR